MYHFRCWAMPFPVRSFTGPRTETGLHARGPISSKGLFQFRYGRCKVPVPELGSMCVVPFPVLGYAISGTVLHWAPYRNWTLCLWSHFRYRALLFRYGCCKGPVPELDSMCVVPFPVPGYAISGTVLHWAHCRNWTLCAWSHFRSPVSGSASSGTVVFRVPYQNWTLPVPARLFLGSP